MHPFFFIRSNGKFVRVDVANIVHVRECKDGVKIFTKDGMLKVHTTIDTIRAILDDHAGK